MKKIFLYSYSKCSTCRKAKSWLDYREISYELIDIIKKPPSKEIIRLLLKEFSLEKKKLFNTRGISFRSLNLKNPYDLSDEKIINLLSKDGKLLKRPILSLDNHKFILGFNQAEFKLALEKYFVIEDN